MRSAQVGALSKSRKAFRRPATSTLGPAPSGHALLRAASNRETWAGAHQRAPAERTPGLSSPTLSWWRRAQRYTGLRRIDCRGRNGQIALAEVHNDTSGQNGHEQQKRPTASQEHASAPKAGRHSRGRYCAGEDKYTPEVEPSA
jgi:hypothetical protein